MQNQTTAQIPDDAVGATIIFEDTCVYGFRSRQNRTGIIEAITTSRIHGRYFTVAVPGFNLPKVITEAQIIAYAHPILNDQATAEAIA